MTALASQVTPKRLTLGEAFSFRLKLGFISFGGPAGQIAIMHEELVERRSWISETRCLHAQNYCMLLPGPEAHSKLASFLLCWPPAWWDGRCDSPTLPETPPWTL